MRTPFCIAILSCCVGVCLAEESSVTTAAPATAAHQPAAAGAPQVMIDLKLVEIVDGKEQVLSHSRLVAVSGRTAKLEVGNDLPPTLPQNVDKMAPPPSPKFVGTKATVTPIVLPDGRIRAEILVRVSDQAGHVRELETGFLFRDGQTAVLAPDPKQSIKLIVTASTVRGEEAKATTAIRR